MATYTVELFRVIDLLDNKIGLDRYEIFDEAEREPLNDLIKSTYMTREIGSDSIELFVYRLETRMKQIMPYYNQMYQSEKLRFDPISNMLVKSRSTREGNTSDTSESTAEASATGGNTSRSVDSTLPQVELSGNGQYATGMTDSNGKSESKSTSGNTAKTDGIANESNESESSGYQGNPNELLAAHRGNMLNIRMAIAAELRDLFMTVWELPNTLPPFPVDPYPSI